jgi:hypothetical protein
MAETIELNDGDCAVVFRKTDAPEIFMAKDEEDELEEMASPAQISIMVVAYLIHHPEEMERLLNQIQKEMSPIILAP